MVKAMGGNPRSRPNDRHSWVLEDKQQERELMISKLLGKQESSPRITAK